MSLRGRIRERAGRLAPPDTRRRALGRAGVNVARTVLSNTREVIEQFELSGAYGSLLLRQRNEARNSVAKAVAETPHSTPVHVVVVTGDRDATATTLTALREQWWPHWRATLLGPGGGEPLSLDPERLAHSPATSVSGALAGVDDRVPALVLFAGDRPERDLLFRVADAFWQNPELELVHWDDGVVDDPDQARFRPEWSPELLLSANYLGRAFALRAASWRGVERPDDPAAYWRQLLSLDLDRFKVQRLPLLLNSGLDRLAEVPPGAAHIVQEALDRRGLPAKAVTVAGAVHLRWQLPQWPRVSVVVPSRFNTAMLGPLLESLSATRYPSWDLTIIDNSGQQDDKLDWYREHAGDLDITVRWWDEPFNYSAVNNWAAARTSGEVLVFLNDDTRILDGGWLEELVGWTSVPGVGTVGLQLLNADGTIQHGGVVMGMDGTAGHLFAGDHRGGTTLLGHRNWIRNTSAVTAACVAVTRENFERHGGFDERFELCGSDVVLGLDMLLDGLRNVCSPAVTVEHHEAVTRGDTNVTNDVYTSYWRYQRWLAAGDPYYSPNLSLTEGATQVRRFREEHPLAGLLPALGRSYGVFRQSMSEPEAFQFARICRAGDRDVEALRASHAALSGPQPVTTVNWFIPDFDNPFYGGINTILRIADQLRRDHAIENRFIVLAAANEAWYRSAIRAAFPALGDSTLVFHEPAVDPDNSMIPPADVAIATIWHSAYAVLAAPAQKRRFYLIQDFEPGFYPGGTMFALSEETYRLGLYGIGNTEPMHTMYHERYGGTGSWFLPAVDRSVFHPPAVPRSGGPVRIFLYARPGHWRNCWEIASSALLQIKAQYGDDVHIVAAGSWARPEDLGRGIEHLGLLDYRETGELYRRCDIGIALTVSEHPSYLPLELMACGVPVVAFDLPEAYWILHHGENALRARQTVEGLREQLEKLIVDPELRSRLAKGALAHIDAHHSDWRAALAPVHGMLVDPEGTARAITARGEGRSADHG